MDAMTPARQTTMPFTPPSSGSGPGLTLLQTTPTTQTATTKEALTPPITPCKPPGAQTSSTGLDDKSPINATKPYTGSFTLVRPIGRGAWSTVSLAEELSSSNLPTPPSTPRSSADLPRQLLAVKTPSQNLARKVLLREAQTLTRLSISPSAAEHIIAFHGFHAPTGSLVLAYAPHTLASYISSLPSPSPSPQPVLGTAAWLSLARSLITSISWLHSLGYAHGDIKPANILLTSTTPLQPVFCDFSSTQPFSSPAGREDALTTAYASPELLAGYLKPGGGMPTAETDIWALSVTLLVAATGEEPFSVAGSEMQRLAMARQGLVMDGFDWRAAVRVKRGGLVHRCTKGALEKDVGKRWAVEQWMGVVEEVCLEEGI